ncbi:MAG TPA: cation-translocating P-type ATPase [Terriglobales bacterium]|nr:cation-translocating P-type ATPase [Terriglobales bacterium]
MSAWHTRTSEETLRHFAVDAALGLTKSEAARRLAEHGPNELAERGAKSPWRILWDQLRATMVLVLLAAAAVSLLLRDYKDTVAILAIVILNTVLGFTQEHRAEQALAALRRLSRPSVRVRRDGRVRDVPAAHLVPGDIMLLEAGNAVAADARLIQVAGLRAQEAALTGESEPVEKQTDPLAVPELTIGDRSNMVFAGTTITYGRGEAVVVATGTHTELGRLAEMIQSIRPEPTPLQKRLDGLGKRLAVFALAVVAVIFALGLLRGEPVQQMLLTAVSLAVAAVPEGLPAVVTVTLALGAQRMLRRKALIRRLPAVETLGSVTVICTDKTGTLTESRITVTVLETSAGRLDLTPHLLRADDRTALEVLRERPAVTLLLAGGALCSDAHLERAPDEPREYTALGDPTEAALVVAAARLHLLKPQLEQALPRVAELPFDSDRKRMMTVHHVAAKHGSASVTPALHSLEHALAGAPLVAFAKGAVDSLLGVSTQAWNEGRMEPLDDDERARILAAAERLAAQGMRVLGVAFRPLPEVPSELERAEAQFVFLGIVGMMDPPRPEVKEAVATCRRAGIRPVMITGDHPLTALHIAHEINLIDRGRAVTGLELTRMSEAELAQAVEEVSVYARVSPAHKLEIVRALQSRGEVVAMTGDGVNDAPALKRADIGVAMGITGTDVAREAADMVLLDDNFATIVAAVREGRVIYDNIRKFIQYLMATNSSEIWVMFLAPLLDMPLPLLPLQILWVNLVTDGLPALALAVEPAERDVMRRPPVPPGQSLFAGGMGWHVLWVGLLIGALCLSAGYWRWSLNDPAWQTLVFTTLTFTQMANCLAIRSGRHSLFTVGVFSNPALLGAVALTLVLQLVVVYTPFLQPFFGTVDLPGRWLAFSVALSVVVFFALETAKRVARNRRATT